MTEIARLRNRLLGRVLTRFPFLSRPFITSFKPQESIEIPWAPVRKVLRDSTVALVTTTGVHHKTDKPFNMEDSQGDPTYRLIDGTESVSDLMITHDYYDHADADRDINIVFPLERLREFQQEGIIGRVAQKHYSFMGHILGVHIDALMSKTSPEVAGKLKADGVDIALLTPG